MRICNQCEEPKPFTDFYRSKRGHQYTCKQCSNAIVSEYRKQRRALDTNYRLEYNKYRRTHRNLSNDRERQRRYFHRHKDRMTDTWLRSGIRQRFGKQLTVTPEMLSAARQRIAAIRSIKTLRLLSL